jgi:hypothetical protein
MRSRLEWASQRNRKNGRCEDDCLKFEKHGVLRFKPNERKVAPARLKATPGRSKKAKEQAVKDTEKKYVA